mmetsp:Transcript_63374/g.149195  ORF Transcript_63374/g.149195 Transcript_63374/m.149195 type:complete len:383 (-) Transcript_63374:142-1290(-)|eukprot:CAMPEP_0177708684 /NCGR_PEP_ID=MMETSP0484_2-20121128/10407_1 /TAXON_ID=354590 /ORGANISM="Rhodomonas lens, Strain RHODO" /LENGTH=382 /DNA_ID=CAMNT_0019220263 /DNA_START=264 /DNA_END=1412 /DNA_ORIENTATION=-
MPSIRSTNYVEAQSSAKTSIMDVDYPSMMQRRNFLLCRQMVACVCVLMASPVSAFVAPILPRLHHQGCAQASAPQHGALLSRKISPSLSNGRRATIQHRKPCVTMSRLGRGDVDDVQLLKIALDQKRNEELMGGHLMSQDVDRLRRYALSVTEQRSPVACDTLGLGHVLEGRWRLALSSDYAWFLSLLPSADIFMDVDCKRRQLQYVLHFRGRYLLLQKLKLISKYDILQGGSQLAMLFFRLVLVIASKPVSLPLPAASSTQAWKRSSYFDGDLWLERSGSSVNVMRYHGPREGESVMAEEEAEKERRAKLGPVARVLAAVRGGWSALWRLSALLLVTVAGLAVIVPPFVVCYCAAAVVMAFSPFRGQHKGDSMPKRRLHRA